MRVKTSSEFDRALALHARGALDEAETAYRAILADDLNQPEVLHCLGVLLHQRGESDAGLSLIVGALQSAPGSASRCNDLGNIYVQRGDLPGAADAFRRAIDLAPKDPNLWNNLGSVLQRQANLPEAESAFRCALGGSPDFVPALTNLASLLGESGRQEESSLLVCRAFVQPPLQGKSHKMLGIAHYRLGRIEQAAECYRAWVAEEPDNPIALHQLAACSGQDVPGRASDRYVAALFDAMAEDFDQKLVAGLSYQGPAVISALLEGCVASGARLEILDGGCGTGLCAPVLAPIGGRLTGVDLSEAMLEKARARGGYDELVHGELTGFLQKCAAEFDLVVMADTLIYFGEIRPLFDAVAGALLPRGLFAFTAELRSQTGGSGSGFELTPSGRYAHDRAYLIRCLDELGFRVQRINDTVLRTEFCRPAHGVAILAIAPASP
jgi:predicted TPR repeat methyltransferase